MRGLGRGAAAPPVDERQRGNGSGPPAAQEDKDLVGYGPEQGVLSFEGRYRLLCSNGFARAPTGNTCLSLTFTGRFVHRDRNAVHKRLAPTRR